MEKILLLHPFRNLSQMRAVVWDIPTRVFHWSLVIVYVVAYLTSRSEPYIEVHVTAGYAALGLVVFRLLWGVLGNRFARFSDFLKGWKEVKSYLTEFMSLKPPRYLGHNPLVGWVVIIMITFTAIIALTGIVIYSGEENKGVFAGLFTFATAQYARSVHILLANIFVFIIVLHICAALIHDFYFKENIIASMITGKKYDPDSWKDHYKSAKPAGISRTARLIALIFLSIVGGWALLFFTLEAKREFMIGQPPKIVDERGMAVEYTPNETWKTECAEACHGPLHPTLLPAESWKILISNLDDHFGDDASLDDESEEEILAFLVKNSAEYSTTEASKKILWHREEEEKPLRITDTLYWKEKHAKIKADIFLREGVYNRINCGACHMDAELGLFEDVNINIPKPEKGGAMP